METAATFLFSTFRKIEFKKETYGVNYLISFSGKTFFLGNNSSLRLLFCHFSWILNCLYNSRDQNNKKKCIDKDILSRINASLKGSKISSINFTKIKSIDL